MQIARKYAHCAAVQFDSRKVVYFHFLRLCQETHICMYAIKEIIAELVKALAA